MTRELVNGWGKEIAKVALGGLIALVPGIIAYGNMQSTVDETNRKVTQHLEVYTPSVYREFVAVQKDVEVCKTNEMYLKEMIQELRKQNEEILRLLKRNGRQ